jgi:hypothetical protein
MRILTDVEKIEILETVKKKLQNEDIERYSGLCYLLYPMLKKYGIDYLPLFSLIVVHFKDFTLKNAIDYANSNRCDKRDFWWETEPYDYKNRLAFLDWMITRIKEGKEGK